eukprot:4036579-Amphidinium_carterae.1
MQQTSGNMYHGHSQLKLCSETLPTWWCVVLVESNTQSLRKLEGEPVRRESMRKRRDPSCRTQWSCLSPPL